MSDLLTGLNDVQQAVVTESDGPMLVLAGAGSGKTRAVIHKIAYLLQEKHFFPMSVLAVTFTNKAAGEMRSRLRQLIGPPAEGLELGTFHSTCARHLRRHAPLVGYSSSYIIYDSDDVVVLFRQISRDLDLDPKKFRPQTLAHTYERLRTQQMSIGEWVESGPGAPPWRAAAGQAFKQFEKRKLAQDAMDFSDLLYKMRDVLEQNDDVRQWYHDRFQYMLVDEMQDTNKIQLELLRLLLGPHQRICAVGDDDQSIYGWRGARVENMLEFDRIFPGSKVLRMEQNYRSTKTILQAANSVIQNNSKRRPKNLWTENDEGSKIKLLQTDSEGDEAARIAQLVARQHQQGVPYRQMAVFYRTNAQSRSFEELFSREQVPHIVVGGIRFYERAEVKDALGYLRVIANPKDEVSLMRIINTPPRGIGKGALSKLRLDAARRGIGVYEAGLELAAEKSEERWARPILQFVKEMEGWRSCVGKQPLVDLLTRVLEESGYVKRLEDADSIESESRLENLESLVASITEFEERNEDPTLHAYLEQIALITDIDLWTTEMDRVPLMTVHAAKGLEFDLVFISGMEQDLFPHASHMEGAELEEERRLFYVALTRARKQIYITHARSRFRFGQTTFPSVSQFVTEVDNDTIDWVGQRRRQSFQQALMNKIRTQQPPVSRERKVVRRPRIAQAGADSGLTGKVVTHPTHGRGRVLAVVGSGDDCQAVVRFDNGKLATVNAGKLKQV